MNVCWVYIKQSCFLLRICRKSLDRFHSAIHFFKRNQINGMCQKNSTIYIKIKTNTNVLEPWKILCFKFKIFIILAITTITKTFRHPENSIFRAPVFLSARITSRFHSWQYPFRYDLWNHLNITGLSHVAKLKISSVWW